MRVSDKGLKLIKLFEGLRLTAYTCPAGVPTLGYGVTHGVTMEDVRLKRTITRTEAEEMLREELATFEAGVFDVLASPNQHEFDACASLAYNIGLAGFKKSSVLKAHNRGDKVAASKAFALWDKATINGKKQVLPGLARRRAAEAALYLEPVDAYGMQPVQEMPQAVEPERTMTDSSINRASVVAGGTATVAAVTQTLSAVNQVKAEVDTMGDWLVPALLVAVVGLCAFVIWQRFDMRSKGLA